VHKTAKFTITDEYGKKTLDIFEFGRKFLLTRNIYLILIDLFSGKNDSNC